MIDKEKKIVIRNADKVNIIVADLQNQIDQWERLREKIEDRGLKQGDKIIIYQEAHYRVMVLEDGIIDGFGLIWNQAKDPDMVVYLKGGYRPISLCEIFRTDELDYLERKMEVDRKAGYNVNDKRKRQEDF